ncbi:MAG: hypothetical protein Q8862_04050 [Bacteroidota bacterium]|nr:hypothetical protein [Bacteroidota bacterium]
MKESCSVFVVNSVSGLSRVVFIGVLLVFSFLFSCSSDKDELSDANDIGNYKIYTGDLYSMVMDKSGQLWAWGNNGCGQFGDGTTENKYLPVKINSSLRFQKISAGVVHTLGIDTDGNLWSWGFNNHFGLLGDGTTVSKSTPVQIKSGTKFIAVSAGEYSSFAIDSDGNLWAWGDNVCAQLGDGATEGKSILTPIHVKSGIKFRSVAAGEGFTLAIDSEGNLLAWGENKNGELGVGYSDIYYYSHAQVKAGTKFKTVSVRYKHSVAIDSDGNLWTWGDNYYGQLGDGTIVVKYTPIQVKIGTKFKSASAGDGFTVAIDNSGNLWVWGCNLSCQLGDGSVEQAVRSVPVPEQIMSGTKFCAVSAGGAHVLALDVSGNLWTWGSNFIGQLGDGTSGNYKSTPEKVKLTSGN